MEDQGEAVVVASLWITQSWWLQLAHLIVYSPIKFSPTRKILYQPNNPLRAHPLQKLWLGAFLRIRKVLQGRGIQRESAYLIILAWRQSTKKQYECYLRMWLKFSGSQKIDPLLLSINVVFEFLYGVVVCGQPHLF